MEEHNEFERTIAYTNRNLLKTINEEKIAHSRTGSYGAAGTSLAILFVLLQAESLDTELSISLYCAIFTLPIFVALAIGTEAFLWFGEKTFPYYREIHHSQQYFLVMIVAYGGLAVSFFGIVAHFSYWALAGVIIMTLMLLIAYSKFHEKLTVLSEENSENHN